MDKFKRYLLSTPDSHEKFIAELSKATGNISLDIETDGADRWLSVAVVFLDRSPEVAFCCVFAPTGTHRTQRRIAQAILDNASLIVWGQFVQFDLGFLAHVGGLVGMPRIIKCRAVDSMVEDFLRQEVVPKGERSLKFLAQRAGVEKFEEDRENLLGLEPQQLARYNCQDALIVRPVVFDCWHRREVKGEPVGKSSRLYERIIPFIAQIEATGFAYSVASAHMAGKEAEDKKKAAEKAIFTKVGGTFNLNSPQQKAWALFGRNSGLPTEEWKDNPSLHLKVPRVKNAYGKTGVASTRKDILEKLGVPEIAEWVLNDKLLANLRNNEKYVRHGLIYPDYSMTRIVSGRIAVTNPALQTYSAKKMPSLKRCFLSRWGPDRGRILKLDGGQMELRWGAMESGCTYLCYAFRGGQDFHQETAELAVVERSLGKTINYASIYGCSLSKLEELGLPPSVARAVKKSLEERWHELYEYEERIKEQIVRTGKTCTAYGFYRRVPGVSSKWDPKVRSALNFRFQAPASHLTQLLGHDIVVNAASLGLTVLPVMTEHDGLSFDVKHSELEEVQDVIKRSVRNLPTLAKEFMNTDLTLPFVFDVTTGPNWLDQKDTSHTYTTVEEK